MSQPSQATARGRRVLMVDDDPDNRELLRIILGSEGLVTLDASSGEEALTVATREVPDLVLLDLMMPGMDGFEVTARLRRAPETKDIPVVIVSALNDRFTRLRALRVGAREFVSKPIDRTDLCRVVRQILGSEPTAPTPR